MKTRDLKLGVEGNTASLVRGVVVELVLRLNPRATPDGDSREPLLHHRSSKAAPVLQANQAAQVLPAVLSRYCLQRVVPSSAPAHRRV